MQDDGNAQQQVAVDAVFHKDAIDELAVATKF